MNTSRLPHILYLLLGLPWLPADGWAMEADAVLLRDQGQEVRASDFRQAWAALPPAERVRYQAEDQAKILLAGLLRGKLMTAEAERLGLDQLPQVKARLADARRTILSTALREHVEATIPLPDFMPLARELYLTRQSELATQGEYQAAHILLKVACEAEREGQLTKITALKAELAAGADFAALARAHSQDASAEAGGNLGGWLDPQHLDPNFVSALAQLPDGGVSEPVLSQFGYHLIKRLAFRPAALKPFEEVQESLIREVRATYLRSQLAEAQQAYNPSAGAELDPVAWQAMQAELTAPPPAAAKP